MRRDQKRKPRIREGGFTLLEVMVAIAVLTFGLLAVATMQSTAIRGNFKGYRLTEATNLAQDRLEFLLAQPFSSTLLSAGDDKTDPRGATPSGYTIEYDVTNMTLGGAAAANARLIEIRVTAQEGGTTTLNYVRPAIY